MTVVPSGTVLDDGLVRFFEAGLCLLLRYAPSVPLEPSMDLRGVATGASSVRLRVRNDLDSVFGIERRVEL
jgi:hypothetical protein